MGIVYVCAFAVVTLLVWNLFERTRRRYWQRRFDHESKRILAHAALAGLERRLTVALLAADVAHDLSSPLGCFKDLLERYAAQIDPEDGLIARDELEKFAQMMHTLRRVQPQPGPCTQVDICACLQNTLLATPLSTKPQIELTQPVWVRGHFERISLALSILIKNADQASHPNGRISIHARNNAEHLAIQIINVQATKLDSSKPRDFFKRWRLLQTSGSGLGLAVAVSILRTYGWQIQHSEQSGQTIFEILIPAAALSPEVPLFSKPLV